MKENLFVLTVKPTTFLLSLFLITHFSICDTV